MMADRTPCTDDAFHDCWVAFNKADSTTQIITVPTDAIEEVLGCHSELDREFRASQRNVIIQSSAGKNTKCRREELFTFLVKHGEVCAASV